MKLQLMIPFDARDAVDNLADALCTLADEMAQEESKSGRAQARRVYAHTSAACFRAVEALEDVLTAFDKLNELQTASPAPRAEKPH